MCLFCVGYWWKNGPGIYIGGHLIECSNSDWSCSASRKNARALQYNGGRVLSASGQHNRATDNQFQPAANCPSCFTMTNSRIAHVAIGVLHWGSSSVISGLEVADFKTFAQVFGSVWIHGVQATCRSGNPWTYSSGLGHTVGNADRSRLDSKVVGFSWYDTMQRHIVGDVVWKNCYSSAVTTVWEMLSHSSEHVPEAMQLTCKCRRVPLEARSRLRLPCNCWLPC